MDLTYLFIVLGSLGTVAVLTSGGIVRRSKHAVLPRKWAAFLVFLAMGSLFIGSSEPGGATSASPDTGRTLRAIVLGFIFMASIAGILANPSSLTRGGQASHWMLIYSLLAMLSSIYSISPIVSLWKGFEVLVFVTLGIYLTRYFTVIEDIQWGIDLVGMAMLYFAASVIFSVILAPSLALPTSQGMSGSIVSGAQSIMPAIYPNSVTQFAALLVSITLCQVLAGSEKRKIGLMATLGLGGIVLILGHSRTSIFAALIACSVILVMGRHFLAAILTGLGVVFGMLIGAREILASYILRGQTEQAFYGMTGRTSYWSEVWEVVLQAPLLGHGFYAQRIILSVFSVDNTYLQILVGLGFVGLLVMLVPLGGVAYKLYLSRPRVWTSSQEKLVWLQLTSIYIIVMTRSMTGPTFQDYNINLVLLMLIIAMARALVPSSECFGQHCAPELANTTVHQPERKYPLLTSPRTS
ncbi:MAG: O-antigen ligase family protein [Nitrospira sp. BO4]|jgi:O-antigen ligase|nr:O-antigen ligase family protein [Nitrospira sp. BO4]